jgi:U1 small nuclear ribonucleoprotein
MLIPPHIRASFMPNPPLDHYPPLRRRRKHAITGVGALVKELQAAAAKTNGSPSPPKTALPTPQMIRQAKREAKAKEHKQALEPMIEDYRKKAKEHGGEFEGMNCYNTLFVGRLAYEVTDRKLLREFEAFGNVKFIKIVKDTSSKESSSAEGGPEGGGKSRGYAFVEYEDEEDMKRAYRAADGMRMEGRDIVVDVERGHTVPSWLPRRLGGGLGGTRLGGPAQNVTRPGRFDPTRPPAPPAEANMMMMGRGGGYRDGPPGPPPYGMGRGGGDRYGGPPRGRFGGGNGGGYDDRFGGGRGGGGGYDDRKRRRSPSPDRRYGGGGGRGPRPRY